MSLTGIPNEAIDLSDKAKEAIEREKDHGQAGRPEGSKTSEVDKVLPRKMYRKALKVLEKAMDHDNPMISKDAAKTLVGARMTMEKMVRDDEAKAKSKGGGVSDIYFISSLQTVVEQAGEDVTKIIADGDREEMEAKGVYVMERQED